MKMIHDEQEIIYDRSNCPTVVINESETGDWPGSASVLRIRLVNADGSEECYFHVGASVKNSRPRVSVETSDGKVKCVIGKWGSI